MLTLEKVKDVMTRQKKFCWVLFLLQGGKLNIGQYPVNDSDDEKEKDSAIDPDTSLQELEDLVETYSDDGEAKFELIFKRTPKSNGSGVSVTKFKAGQAHVSGLGSVQGLGALGQLLPFFQTNKADQHAMMQVIAKEQLLEYKSQQLDKAKEDFEKEKKAWHADHKELKEKWEKLRDATKEGAMDAAPDLLKGIIDALRGDKAPEVKPLAGADAGKEKEADPQMTAEQQIIEDLASWMDQNLTNIYTLRQVNVAVKSPGIRDIATFLAREIVNEDGTLNEEALVKIKGTIEKIVTQMKGGN